LKEILDINKDGPFFIGGWSMGALLAYEVARQLEAMEKKVGLLVIIDQNIKDKYGKFNFWSDNIWRGSHMMKLNIALRTQRYKQEKKYLASGFYGILSKLTNANAELSTNIGPVSEEMVLDPSSTSLIRELDHHMKMVAEYSPGRLSAPVLILRCLEGEEKDKKKNVNLLESWKEIAPHSKLVDIHCNHYIVMKEPYVKEVADVISKELSLANYQATGVPRESSKLQSKGEILGMKRAKPLAGCPQCTNQNTDNNNNKPK